MPFCHKCGAELIEGDRFCSRCGSLIEKQISPSIKVSTASQLQDFFIVTTPTVPGYRVEKVLGIVTGLTARTRGVGGQIVAGIQSMVGGEVSAFTSEIEKARSEAMERMKEKARSLGANAIIGLDMETSDVLQGTVLISATGTAVIIEQDRKS